MSHEPSCTRHLSPLPGAQSELMHQSARSARASPLLTLSLANKYYLLTGHLKVLELRLYQPSELMQGEILLISVFLEVEDVP